MPLQDQRVTSTLDHVGKLLQFPDVHPYRKYCGTHWRLVELADLGTPIPPVRLQAGIDQEIAWLLSTTPDLAGRSVGGLPRRHASMEGNALYAFSRLGFAHHPSTRRLAEALIEWQWPDGGWNCDRHRTAHRSSFHESVTPALGLAAYADQTGNAPLSRRPSGPRSFCCNTGYSAFMAPGSQSTRRGRSFTIRRTGITTCSKVAAAPRSIGSTITGPAMRWTCWRAPVVVTEPSPAPNGRPKSSRQFWIGARTAKC
jgi:hypothetical protein